jgi:RNA polymerase sigma-70 factor (ECF subfamily)
VGTVAIEDEFTGFVAEFSERLWRALVVQFGPDVAQEAAADTFAYAWQHWDRIRGMANPRGYLYQAARHYAVPRVRGSLPFDRPEMIELGDFEPRLVPALADLTVMQRTVVYLVDGCEWRITEVADVLGLKASTVRNHRKRALAHLRDRLEVNVDV